LLSVQLLLQLTPSQAGFEKAGCGSAKSMKVSTRVQMWAE
jgi:hypothetical protein